MTITERNVVAIGMNRLRELQSAMHYARHSNGIAAAECSDPGCAETAEILRMYQRTIRGDNLMPASWYYLGAFLTCPYCGQPDHGVRTDDIAAVKAGESAHCEQCGREFVVPQIPGVTR